MSEMQTTLESYDAHVAEYIAKTPPEVSGDVKRWIDSSLGYIALDADILELGSGFGRDADYIESNGYSVSRTEGARGFVDYMRGHGHPETRLLNAITGEYGGPFDMVFADAVLLHFTEYETTLVMRKVGNALKPKGIFSFRLKQGDGSEWESDGIGAPRFFQYWQPEALEEALHRNDFTILSLEPGTSKFNSFNWLQVIVRANHSTNTTVPF